jgi:mannose-6-phosphate isomerase
MKIPKHYVEKPWGRTDLPAIFDAPANKRIGEILFTAGADLPLLAKYIFTSQPLSVQVHPSDEQARARGLPSGKSECWYIVEADGDAKIGIGLTGDRSRGELRRAALDGSIESLLEWHEVRAGDFYFVPSGTIHAIGPGLKLIEIQQNADVTYRLFDYGRGRGLHVDDAVAVASVQPYPREFAQHVAPGEDRILVDGPHFRVVHAHGDAMEDRWRWVMPLEGAVRSAADEAAPGECLLLAPAEQLICDRARILIGAAT